MRRIHACLVAVLMLSFATHARAQDSTLQRALRDELARSISSLRLGQLERPYFIAYHASDLSGVQASATNGSLLGSDEMRARQFFPEVRVGDYAFDNTNFVNFGSSGGLIAVGSGTLTFGFGDGDLPLDDNYLELRRQIWLSTDAAYKAAAETFAAKRAALLNRSGRDSLPDFSRSTPTQATDTMPSVAVDRAQAEVLVRGLSAVPELVKLEHSSVEMSVGNKRTMLIDSEGTTTITGRPLIAISASASTQAIDGAPLGASIRVYARSMTALPPRDELAASIRSLALRLDSVRAAPVIDRYSGPVLVEGAAAAELFAQSFVPGLVGRRRPAAGRPELTAMMESMGRGSGSFTERIGSRVLPAFLNVVDDPTVSEYDGAPLLGGYRVDDEGVLARRKALVTNGVVERVLTTRQPVPGGLQSTGNRRGGGAAPSNIIVSSTSGVTDAELKARLLALAKQRGLEYGIVVREFGGATVSRDDPMELLMSMREGRGGKRVLRAYRVYPDGREQLVRGALLVDVSAQSFKDVVAVAKTGSVYHLPALSGGGMSISFELMAEMGARGGLTMPMTSYVVPSLLFDDLSLEHVEGEQPKPPLSPPPGAR